MNWDSILTYRLEPLPVVYTPREVLAKMLRDGTEVGADLRRVTGKEGSHHEVQLRRFGEGEMSMKWTFQTRNLKTSIELRAELLCGAVIRKYAHNADI